MKLSISKLLKGNSWILILIFCLSSTSLYAQVTEVAFMKVTGNEDDYRRVEQEWKKVHQKRLDNEMIYAWYLLRRSFAGTADDYNYATVTVFPTIGAMQNELPNTIMEGTNPTVIEKTDSSRDIVKVEVYDTPIVLEITNLPQYLNMEFMKVEEGMDEAYLSIENEVWKPLHAEMKARGVLGTWSVYRQLYPGGYGGEYNYVVINGFADLKKVTFEPAEGWEELMAKISPELDFAEVSNKTFDTRKLVKNELWEIIEVVAPQ